MSVRSKPLGLRATLEREAAEPEFCVWWGCGFQRGEINLCVRFTDECLYLGVFYKLREKERSKESAYVLVAFRFLARPFVSFVSHIARYAPSLTDKSSSLRNQKSTQPNF